MDQRYSEKYAQQRERPTLRPRQRQYVRRNISSATERLQQGRISVEEFLIYTSHLAYDPGT